MDSGDHLDSKYYQVVPPRSLPLALLGFVFASIVAQLRWRDGAKPVAAVAVILALGSFTPALEIQRALMVHAFAISDCNLLTTWHHDEPAKWLANHFARADRMPTWLLAPSGQAGDSAADNAGCRARLTRPSIHAAATIAPAATARPANTSTR
jgi:hypothetical protein